MPAASTSISGLTLVELLVAMSTSLLVTLAAMSGLQIGQEGLRAVDASTQLQENAYFASELIRRTALQAGFVNAESAPRRGLTPQTPRTGSAPHIQGFNNARYSNSLLQGSLASAGINNSDVLVIRYQASGNRTSETADASMIDCAGMTDDTSPQGSTERLVSIFHINLSNGEPTLMCTRYKPSTGQWDTQPLVAGVENLQVLYGTHGVIAHTAPTPLTAPTLTAPTEHYLRADQLSVHNDLEATYANWARVRSLRVGLLLRGPEGSAPPGPALHIPLLGSAAQGFSSATTDPGSLASPPPTDRRLRQALTFTVHLRNTQDPW